MSMTTIRVDSASRSRLAAVARKYFGGASQDTALNRLIDEFEMKQVHAAYERLRDDPAEWAAYQDELGLTDNTAGDGLGDARDEYPEYNQ